MAETSQYITVVLNGIPTRLEVDANLWGTGTVAQRPGSGDNVGDIYIVQDPGASPPVYRFDVWNGTAWIKGTVKGPSGGSTDNALVRWDGTGADVLNNSVIIVDDSGNMTGVGTVNGQLVAASAFSPDFDGLARFEWTVESLGDLADLDPISTLTDVGPNAIAVSNTGTARPTYHVDGALGPTMRFDTTDDTLTATGLSLDWSNELVIFLVEDVQARGVNYRGPISAKTTAAGHTAHSLEFYQTNVETYVWVVNRDIASLDYWTAAANQAQNRDGPRITTARMDSTLGVSDGPVRVNGAPITVTESGALSGPVSTVEVLSLGHGYAGTPLGGDLYAVVAYTGRTMTIEEVEAVEQSLNQRFRVVPPPSEAVETWRLDEATAEAAPASGWFRLNNATHASATELYIHEDALAGPDTTSVFTSLGDTDYIRLQSRGYAGRFRLYRVNGAITDNTTWLKIPVTSVDGAGDFLSGEDVLIRPMVAGKVSHTYMSAPSPSITGDVITRWDAGAANTLQGSGVGLSDSDQMTGLVTASFIDYMVNLAGAAATIDWNDSASQWIILGANATFTFTAPPAGARVMLRVIQDGTGSRTVTWPSTVRWLGGSAPTLSTTAGDVDIVTFFFDGTTYWGSAAGAVAWNLVQELSDAYGAHLLWPYSTVTDSFPVLEEVTSEHSAFGTTHNIDLPAEVNAGDLLLVSISFGLNDTFVSSADADFTEIQAPVDSSNAVTLCMYLRKADGTEGGGTFDITLSSSSLLEGQVHRFRAGTWYDDGTLANAYTLGTAFIDLGDATPDPPIANPGTAAKYHFVTVFGADGEPTISSYPTNYVNGTETRGGAGGGTATTLGSATRELDAASETPGYFTISLTEESVSQTIAIHPAEGLVLDYSSNRDHGILTTVSSAVGAGLLPGDLGAKPTTGATGYANRAALTADIAAAHSVIKLFNYTAAATIFDINDSGGYRSSFDITTATLTYNDGTARDTGRAEASIENQAVLLGYTRTSTTNIDLYENGLKWRSLTTGTFSTQTAPEVSDGATAAGATASDGDMSIFGIFNTQLSSDEHYAIWKKLSGQAHFWKEFVEPQGLAADCVQYLVLWEQAGTQLLDVSGNQAHGTVTGTLTLGAAALDAYHVSSVTGDGTTDYIDPGLTAINVSTTTTWTIAGVCTSSADGDGIFSFGSANNAIGLRTVATGNIEVFADDTASTSQSTTKPSGAFAWCVRRNGNTLDWWLNGVQQTALDLTSKTFSSNTGHHLMAEIDTGVAASLAGGFQHRGTYDAAFTDAICAQLGTI